ncbi:RTA1 like protein-domain-containing protein [Plectosphaerella plurivora]|uniref:RTA1 like protein-domain-containing protein n=1 Tax=Plectosphaerella plurivora TaxID=936078 RepID=A0A9P8VJ83_9PEZI|nr:RTA1 like protein-domain-containing protein [Plectosphaerella plurivora]
MVLRICTAIGNCKDSEASSFFGHRPSLVAGFVFVAVASLAILANIGIAFKARRHYGFVISMVIACGMSVSGWIARYVGARDPWLMWPWVQSTWALALAPTYIAIAIYPLLGFIVGVVGEEHSPLSPKIINAGFLTSELIALVLQLVGFGVAFHDVHRNTLNVNAETYAGARIVMAASALQLLTLLLAIALMALVGLRAIGARRSPKVASLASTFFVCVGAIIATMAILAGRLGYRVALLSGGFRGAIAQNWILFIVFDGAAVAFAIVTLTALHPSFFLVAGRTGSVQGREGRFEKLHDAEDAALVERDDTRYVGAAGVSAPAYSDETAPMSVPLQPMVFEPPRSYDPQPQEPSRYESTRAGDRRSLTPQPYETGDLSAATSRDTSPKPYGSGGL